MVAIIIGVPICNGFILPENSKIKDLVTNAKSPFSRQKKKPTAKSNDSAIGLTTKGIKALIEIKMFLIMCVD